MKITDLQPDRKNARTRTARGHKAIQHSLRELGAGRSILLDKHGTIIAGNGVIENAAKVGISEIVVVPSDGTKIVAVQRVDLDLTKDPKAQQLAIADNRTAEFAEWNPEALKDISGSLDLQPFFTAPEIGDITGDKCEPANDASSEWSGMPEYSSTDLTGCRTLIVHFATHEDVAEFAKRLEHPLTPRTKSIWFPRAERLDLQSEKYV